MTAHKTLRPLAGFALIVLTGALLLGQTPARHFLWKVTAENGNEAYLLGSIHVATAGFYPLSPVIERAFAQSNVLVEELDLDEMKSPATMMSLAGRAMLPAGQTLADLVSKEVYAAVAARAASSGLPVAALDRMKPWMVGITLAAAELVKAGFDATLGIDKHFYDRAKQAGLSFRPLETAAYQFERLDGLSPAIQEAWLKAALDEADTETQNIVAMATAWTAGDTPALERLLADGFADAPEVAERLLYERNRNWVAPVERCLTENARCFVVVGAGHLVGPGSLVDLLRARKHRVEQQ